MIIELTMGGVGILTVCALVLNNNYHAKKQAEKDAARKALKDDLVRQLIEVESQIQTLVTDSLSQGKIIRLTEIEDSVVICGNGRHRHSFKSFEHAFGNVMDFTLETNSVARSTSSTETKTTIDGKVISRTEVDGQTYVPQMAHAGSSKIVTRRGCPTCKTDLFEFEQSHLQSFMPCVNSSWASSESHHIPDHWTTKSDSCPVCHSTLLKRRSDIKSQLASLDVSK